jgi:hypothetical protein
MKRLLVLISIALLSCIAFAQESTLKNDTWRLCSHGYIWSHNCDPAKPQIHIPPFKIECCSLLRTSAYEYREAADKGKRYLEIRQFGKTKWARVEELKCTKPGQNSESESFDYDYSCATGSQK